MHYIQAQEVHVCITYKHRRCMYALHTSTGGVCMHYIQAQEVHVCITYKH